MRNKEEIPTGHYVEFDVSVRGGVERRARVHGNDVIEVWTVLAGWRIVNPKKANRLTVRVLETLLEQWEELEVETR